MAVHVVDHPLIRHKLGIMRKDKISTKDFRELASDPAGPKGDVSPLLKKSSFF